MTERDHGGESAHRQGAAGFWLRWRSTGEVTRSSACCLVAAAAKAAAAVVVITEVVLTAATATAPPDASAAAAAMILGRGSGVCHIHAHQVLELSPPAPRTPDRLRRRRLCRHRLRRRLRRRRLRRAHLRRALRRTRRRRRRERRALRRRCLRVAASAEPPPPPSPPPNPPLTSPRRALRRALRPSPPPPPSRLRAPRVWSVRGMRHGPRTCVAGARRAPCLGHSVWCRSCARVHALLRAAPFQSVRRARVAARERPRGMDW